MAVTRVGLGPGGRPVARKAARGEDVRRLLQEAAFLERLRHPGVVELIAVDTHGDGSVELTTAYVGPQSLADLTERGGLSAQRATRLLADAAATLADAHDLGIPHGRLSADHILVAPGDRTVLCGWGQASASPPADVAALGALITDVVPRDGDPALVQAVAAIASNATATDSTARPTMRGMAAALRALLPVERPAAAEEPQPGHRRRLVVTAIAATLMAVGIAIAGVAAAGGDRVRRPALDPSRAGDAADATTTTQLPPDTPRRVWPPSQDAAPAEVANAGQRYAVGAAGDLVAVGDWDCDGRATPAVVRAATGTVYVFDHWPDVGAEIAGRHVATVPGARAARAVDAGDDRGRCDVLEVSSSSGEPVVLHLAR